MSWARIEPGTSALQQVQPTATLPLTHLTVTAHRRSYKVICSHTNFFYIAEGSAQRGTERGEETSRGKTRDGRQAPIFFA